MRTLVTGGARSGKSTFAESVMGGNPVDYVATGYPASPEDPDWSDRVRRHQERRPADWRTIETLDVAGILLGTDASAVLVDCVGLWLTRTADELNAWAGGSEDAVEAQVSALLDALSRTSRDVVLVTNEVGLGLVPDTASGRWFRDALGRLNIGLAERCDEVWLCVAGIPVPVKHG